MSSDPGSRRERWLANIGRAIRQFRHELGVSQEELGYRAGLHRTYVSDLERGRRNPTAWTLRQLAEALGVEPSEIFERAERVAESEA